MPPPALIVLVASTGGPRVLRSLLPALARDLLTPVVIVQHMASGFVEPWTHRLSAAVGRRVRVAGDGDVLRPRSLFVAPSGLHATVERDGCRLQLRLTAAAAHAGCRPSGSILMQSAAAATDGRVAAAVLTGMGWDGAAGAEAIAAAGGRVFAQSEATSVVWGMPRAVWDRVPEAMLLDPEDIVVALRDLAWLDSSSAPARAQAAATAAPIR